MMQTVPLACCGVKPHLDNYEPNPKYGIDPVTNKCRNCGEDHTPYVCDTPNCRRCTDNKERFCESCEAAFQIGFQEGIDIGFQEGIDRR